MVETNSFELTDAEAELYDRQIRLWGLESQKRIRTARILIAGLNGLGAEVAKNIILSGVKSVTLLDHKAVSKEDICSQFLAPHADVGKNRAEASLSRAQTLNPMVEIVVDKENIADKPDSFFGQFDVVVAIEAPTAVLVRVDNVCRASNVKFFSGDVWGLTGYSFADLKEHEYVEDVVKHKIVSKESEKTKSETVVQSVKRTMSFPSLEEVRQFDLKSPAYLKRLKRTGPTYLVVNVLQQFRDAEGRDPSGETRAEDSPKLLKLRDALDESVPDSAFTHVFAQISPAAAIVGGALSQEIIKAISQKEAPNRNVFLFDPETCCGFIEDIFV